MPSWGIHLATAKKVLEKINIEDENDFIFGNILPDIENGYLFRDVSHIVSHPITHYDLYPREKFSSHNRFFNIYEDNMNNKVILGYLVHLLTDNLWNKDFYEKKAIFNEKEIVGIKLLEKVENSNFDTVRKIKQRDFKIFADYLFSKDCVVEPTFDQKLIEKSNAISVININEKDIKKSIDYINKEKIDSKIKDIKLEYKTFSEREIEEFFIEVTNKIIEYLTKEVLNNK